MTTPRHTAPSSANTHGTFSASMTTIDESVENVIKQNITDIRRYFEENIRNKREVEKALKTTLLEVIRLYHRFTGEIPVKTWLFNIAHQVLEHGVRKNTKIATNGSSPLS